MIELVGKPLGFILGWCYALLKNYALAIALFTLLTKIILLPVAIWVQRNGIAMVALTPELNRLKVKYYGDKDAIAEEQQALYKREHYHPLLGTIPMFIQLILLIGVIGAVRQMLAGTASALGSIPWETGGATLLMPLAAGASALALGFSQNRLNPLQKEQSRAGQISTNGLSIAISLLLGAFVPLGVGLYWICSNLFTIAQQLLLNVIVKPAKYIDYQALESSRKELGQIDSLGVKSSAEDKKRERADYKRFFSVANKHLVFYSERSGFYKYFKGLIEELLKRSNISIHYVTSDPQDQIFEIAKTQPRIKPYYIGEKRLITLMMKMDADMVVMTVPDLDNFHIKRSYVRKDVEYVYMFHYPLSTHMVLHTGALDHYDTIFCVGKFQFDEIRFCEQLHGTPEKKLIEGGYGLLEELSRRYKAEPRPERKRKKILIATSWQEDNILDTCIDDMLDKLLGRGYDVKVRPHPEYMRRYGPRMDAIVQRYADYQGDDLSFELDFTSSVSIFDSDLVITDWSGTAYEFSFVTKKPSLFINTPPKVNNAEYEKYPMQPLELSLRSQVGAELSPADMQRLPETVEGLFSSQARYHDKIQSVLDSTISNFGSSAEVEAKYILSQMKERQKHGS